MGRARCRQIRRTAQLSSAQRRTGEAGTLAPSIAPPVARDYATSMQALLADAAARAHRYLTDIETRPVAPSPAALAALAAFDTPLPAGPGAPADTLRLLDELGSPATTGMAGPRFFGFVIGGALPAALAANWLATAWDQNAALHRPTPSAAFIEQVALRWLLDILHLPPTCGGAFVTGATVANLTALAAARHACWRAPVGTSRPTASSVRRPSPSSSVVRFTRPFRNRSASSASAAAVSSKSPSTSRVA
jgi:hypothetical protein